jgi:hypothetical protein
MTYEQAFYTYLHKRTPGHFQRIESSTGSGIPDIFACWKGRSIWIEAKVGTNFPILRREQFAWGTRQTKNGGRVFVGFRRRLKKEILFYKFPLTVKKYGNKLKVTAEPYLVFREPLKPDQMEMLFDD